MGGFKVIQEFEIEGYNGDKCGYCCYGSKMYQTCECFPGHQEFEYDNNGDKVLFRLGRCIEAEKQYKEKENA